MWQENDQMVVIFNFYSVRCRERSVLLSSPEANTTVSAERGEKMTEDCRLTLHGKTLASFLVAWAVAC